MISVLILSLIILKCDIVHVQSLKVTKESTNTCNDLLNDFSTTVANYTYCTVMNAKPVTMCENCADHYYFVSQAYKQLVEVVVNGTVCINNFINLDRLQIVSSVYKNVNNLWSRAKCSDCIIFVNGTHSSNKIKKKFDKLFAKFKSCTDDYYSSTEENYCSKCINDYIELNNYYFSVGGITHGIDEICMDIVDMMNKTQASWSKKCCHYREKNEIIYLITTGFMLLLPVMFYTFITLFVEVKNRKLLPQNRLAESMNNPSTSFNRNHL